MKILLDTHIFLWLNAGSDRLSPTTRNICEDPENLLYISIASLWEIQIKRLLGKLQFDMPWQEMLQDLREETGIKILPVELGHVLTLEKLPAVHRDPFDRMLIAQAIYENCSIVTVDAVFSNYPVSII